MIMFVYIILFIRVEGNGNVKNRVSNMASKRKPLENNNRCHSFWPTHCIYVIVVGKRKGREKNLLEKSRVYNDVKGIG